jgi:hypothetical protein
LATAERYGTFAKAWLYAELADQSLRVGQLSERLSHVSLAWVTTSHDIARIAVIAWMVEKRKCE